MEVKGYRLRVIDKKISEYLSLFGALSIEGPKWCGKTWTCLKQAKSQFFVSDPQGNFNNRRLAEMNPSLVLKGDSPRLIDEWQEVPSLWDAVRSTVDFSSTKGLFLLTGSATVNPKKHIHSGTGRIASLRMRPMSLFESGDSTGDISLKDICFGKAGDKMTGEVELERLAHLILKGGWPATIGMNESKGSLVAKEYVKAILKEDIYRVDEVKRDSHKVELLLRSLARNEATMATNRKLQEDISSVDADGVSIDTVGDDLNLLRRLYLTENLPPYSLGLRSSLRAKQSEKRHFVDPSLPCAILRLTTESLLKDLEFFGFLFESLVERDLFTYAEAMNGALYHYQDYQGNEIDSVIEREDGRWCGFEIKLGANQIDKAAENLLRINEKIGENGGQKAATLCVICGLSNAAYRRPDGVYVVPITSLRE